MRIYALVPFHKGNGTGGTDGTSLDDYPEGRYAPERIQAFFFVPLVPLVPHIPWNGTEQTADYHWKKLTILVPSVPLVPHRGWNGTEQGRWFGPMFTSAAQPFQEKAVKASSLR